MKTPVDAERAYQNGNDLLKKGKPADAEACFRVAVAARPDWAEAHNNLGVTLANRGKECNRRLVANRYISKFSVVENINYAIFDIFLILQ